MAFADHGQHRVPKQVSGFSGGRHGLANVMIVQGGKPGVRIAAEMASKLPDLAMHHLHPSGEYDAGKECYKSFENHLIDRIGKGSPEAARELRDLRSHAVWLAPEMKHTVSRRGGPGRGPLIKSRGVQGPPRLAVMLRQNSGKMLETLYAYRAPYVVPTGFRKGPWQLNSIGVQGTGTFVVNKVSAPTITLQQIQCL
eukprot:gnl/MRDRNA2_/MRDRNA2_128539_c0_seq1.p1 gnl/MRDRNA2_/MRDRNA2_128539_c0~~gnl/MRDRNA2_/MRDRNA2_128539_c0_seq1.p1  ORF type:complete len:197 (-),score=26.72 gnl/MRDRNA2_/MRDRNA2_128539_c0_seq1:125-715(-)